MACEATPVSRQSARPCNEDTIADRFFEQGAFAPQVELDDEIRDTTARYLLAANEVSWICGDTPIEGYRLFVGGGHNLPGIVASAARTSSGWQTAFSTFESPKPAAAYVVKNRGRNDIDNFPSSDVRQALQRAAFWSGPTWQEIEAEGDIVMIEVLDGDHRAVIQAVATPEFQNAAALLLSLTTGSDDAIRMRYRAK